MRLLGRCLGENVAVLGYSPLPTWSLSNGRQAPQGLVTGAMLYHNSVNILQMAAHKAAICPHLATGVGTCADAMHARPTKLFYKSGAHRISGLTFSKPLVGSL